MAAPTSPPWREQEDRESIWLEGPEASAASERFPKDRRVICSAPLSGDEAFDAETRANFALLLAAGNRQRRKGRRS